MKDGTLEGRRILVLEDEGLVAMHIADSIDELGCLIVGPVKTVEEALASIEVEHLDAALLDVNLGGGKTSYPVAEELGRRGVPFAFLTGYGEHGVDIAFRSFPVVAKPIDQRKLLQTLEAIIASTGG